MGTYRGPGITETNIRRIDNNDQDGWILRHPRSDDLLCNSLTEHQHNINYGVQNNPFSNYQNQQYLPFEALQQRQAGFVALETGVETSRGRYCRLEETIRSFLFSIVRGRSQVTEGLIEDIRKDREGRNCIMEFVSEL